MTIDLLVRRSTHFVLWAPHDVEGFHKERLATMFRYVFPLDEGMDEERRERQNREVARRVKLGFACREVSQQRDVPDAFVGREPLFPWEAKVYARR
jgi:hypothetical protein